MNGHHVLTARRKHFWKKNENPRLQSAMISWRVDGFDPWSSQAWSQRADEEPSQLQLFHSQLLDRTTLSLSEKSPWNIPL